MTIIGEVCRILGFRQKHETQEMAMLRHYYTAAKDYEIRMNEQSVLMNDMLESEQPLREPTNIADEACLLLELGVSDQ